MSAAVIAQVTHALKELLRANLDNQVSVTLLQPSDTLSGNSLNLYLYRVAENAQLKNTAWAGDRRHAAAATPALALDLYYLLTPFATPPDAHTAMLPQAHTLLGQAMQVFHEQPVLNDVHTAAFDFDTLTGIDALRDSFGKVIIRLQPISLEELSKLWGMFTQPYRLSVVYQVSLVQIAPVIAPPRAAPVAVTQVEVFTADPPRLTALDPAAAGGVGGLLTLRGYGLARRSFTTGVRFGGLPVVPANVTERQLKITLPVDLEAGPEQAVRVLLDGQASNPLTYVVSPWVRSVQPVRGAPGPLPTPPVPVVVEVVGEALRTAASIAVTLGGSVLPHTVIDDTHVRFNLPPAQPSGFYPVRVSANGRTSNARPVEVTPLITDFAPAMPGVGGALQINGQRLNGSQVRVDFGPATFEVGVNASATQVQVPHVPRLDSGPCLVRVTVDGHTSNSLTFTVP